jgi:hypothetical protein
LDAKITPQGVVIARDFTSVVLSKVKKAGLDGELDAALGSVTVVGRKAKPSE